MRWNPFWNALAATAYVWGIGLLVHYIGSLHPNTPDSVVDPIAALSLLVFSAAVMGFLFFYRPIVLLTEHKKGEAVSYFLKTLAIFGLVTLLVVIAIL